MDHVRITFKKSEWVQNVHHYGETFWSDDNDGRKHMRFQAICQNKFLTRSLRVAIPTLAPL
jgi:hypothetical protein